MTRWYTAPRPVKARKPHLCSWCGEDIERGETYQGWTYGDPTPERVRMHEECYQAFGDFDDNEFSPFEHERDGCGAMGSTSMPTRHGPTSRPRRARGSDG